MKKKRQAVQALFLGLTLIGVFIVRGNAERWCPFGGVEAIYTYIQEGNMVCSLGVSNFYILIAVLIMTLLFKRIFCSYVCPIGTISEWLYRPSKIFRRIKVTIPYRLNRFLGMGKYLVLALILYFTWKSGELMFRGYDPCYALLSRHGEDIAIGTYFVAGIVILASLFILIPFCRWFCPLAAVLNPLSRLGFFRIHRHQRPCIDCGRCRQVCPSAIPVNQIHQVRQASCTNCMSCIDACPAKDNHALTWGLASNVNMSNSQWLVIVSIVLCIALAVTVTVAIPIASFVHERGAAGDIIDTHEFQIQGVNCRGSASLLVFFLERTDFFEVPGYLKIEAWPDPHQALVRISFDPDLTSSQAIMEAITEPYYDQVDDRWRNSPFQFEGYDPLAFE